MTREQIEAVLRKHQANLWCPASCCPSAKGYEHIISDLLACVPVPSREGLEKILDREEEPSCNFPQHPNLCKCFLDTLMAWAQGEEANYLNWCSHIVWITDRWRYYEASTCSSVPATWISCPLCAAPRPVRA